ncbi:tubulin polyglutamylase complex subunit 2 isoform X2 [Pseudoliparis swirei]|uniref:tubulin polyglutamylase complex subunit 2 isoform X2 n=1 Tax=Pseudoliparis swirei TaxID=2059687 RepID=UPI0024BE8406|nr:tubulin polyglutamylase complex subunit 2 isoform X2 [Pseudoliparis swirei]
MEEARESFTFKGVAERLTLGVTRILENMPGVGDVRLVEREPAEKRSLLSWEQRNTCILPEDLRDFYLTTDGLTLTWSVKLDEECVPLGSMVVPSVSRLRPLLRPASLFSLPGAPALADLDWEDTGSGVVAQQSDIWYLDRALCWHLLTSSFTSYYRLMVTHLGLPEWQQAFTPYGPSPRAKQWASLYQPLTFSAEPGCSDPDPHLNKLDPARAFRGGAKTPVPKKKQAAPNGSGSAARSHGGAGRLSGGRR